MSPASPFSGIDAIRGYCVGNIGGTAVEVRTANCLSDEQMAVMKSLASAFGAVGQLLGIGETSLVVSRGNDHNWVVAFRDGYALALDVEPGGLTAGIEAIARSGEWIPKGEVEANSASIRPDSCKGEPPASAAATTAAAKPTLAREFPPVPKPPVPRRTVAAATATAPNVVSANARGLRRALIRGDLKDARALAEHLKNAEVLETDPCGTGPSARVIAPLVTAIASVLCGDSNSGLQQLAKTRQLPDIGPSLSWVVLVWSARANIPLPEGLNDALACAEAAGRLSKQLDVEARMVSARLIAEVCFYRANLVHAERFADQARRLAESLADRDESAEIALLQARILEAVGKRDQAIRCAQRANVYRQNWAASISFLCRCALGAGDLARARRLIAPFVDSDGTAADIVRVARVIDAVEHTGLSTADAAELLLYDEAPAGCASIARLEELAAAYPDHESICASLGWKLLKAGQYRRASEVLVRLSQRQDLRDDVRVSLLLALGYLESRTGAYTSPGAAVRAIVNVAPSHLESPKLVTHSTSRMRVARPMELAAIQPALPCPPAERAFTGESDSSRAAASTLVLTGELGQLPLPELLEFLRLGRRSGTLVCVSSNGSVGALCVADGNLSAAAAPGIQDLRAMLVASGRLSASLAQKADAIRGVANRPQSMGRLLVENRWSDPGDVASCLCRQATSAVAEMLGWSGGQFAFDPGNRQYLDPQSVAIALDPRELLRDIHAAVDGRTRAMP